MPRPIAAGVFGMARTTLPPQTASSTAMVVPAMIETTSVDGPANGLNVAPASRNDLRLHRDHQRIDRRRYLGCGLSRMPCAASALISGGRDAARSPRRAWRRGRRPAIRSASRRPSCRRRRARWCRGGFEGCCCVLTDVTANTRSSSLRTQGPITTGGFSEAREGPQAVCLSREVTAYGSLRSQERRGVCGDAGASGENYASPSVSNIAALIASAAVLPAQTTNWNAG